MTTTITLTPTLTLSVADQRMPQPTIEAVWAAITQHTRATGRTSTIAVMDGTEQLRMWQLTPNGTRTPLDTPPATTPEVADFRLLLSPWTMSVPREEGPDFREVSTLTVARAQAQEAATAGGTDLILQTAGTDEDTAETISPTDPEAVPATQELDEADKDLFDELINDEDGTTPDEATRRFRRRAIIGGSALALLLAGSMAAAGWSVLATPEQTETGAAAPAASPTAAEPSPTEDPSASPIRAQAQAPTGFSGTPTWEVVGATDQSSGLSWTGKEVAAVSGRALDIVETESGDVLDSLELPQTPDAGPVPLAAPTGEGGLLLPDEDSLMTWSDQEGLTDTPMPEDHRLVLRGTTAFTVPHNDDTRPDAIQLVTPEGLKEITSPGSSASPIGPSDSGGFLWASGTDGGTLIHAGDDGETENSTRLIGPSSGTTISKWLGATDDYAAAIWANDGSGSVLTIHDAQTGEVVDTENLGTTGAGAGLRVVPSHDDQHLFVGSTPIDLSTGNIGEPVEGLSTSNRTVAAVPGGWIGSETDGTQMLISPDGKVQASPTQTESLLGIAESGDIVVDHRGAVAAFSPAPDEGDDQ